MTSLQYVQAPFSYVGVFSQTTLDIGYGSYYAGNIVSLTLTDSTNNGYNQNNRLLCIQTIQQSTTNIVSSSAFIYPNNINTMYTGYWQILTDRGVYSNMTYQAGDIVIYTDGKAYVAINDNTTVSPPNAGWILISNYPTSSGVICFLQNAPVLTPTGYRRIDRLKVGDLVQTPTGSVAIQVIKKQKVTASPSVNPYIIPKGYLGATRDLAISPEHKVQVGDKMIEARYLSLQQKTMHDEFTYYNLELPDYEKMIVAGVIVESLYPISYVSVTAENFREIVMAKYGAFNAEILMSLSNKIRFSKDGIYVPVDKRLFKKSSRA